MKAGRREMTKLKRRKEPTGVRSRGSSMPICKNNSTVERVS